MVDSDQAVGTGSAKSSALKAALVYLLIGGLWILLSDRAVLMIWRGATVEQWNRMQTVKGWFFVAVTGVLLYMLVYRRLAAFLRSQAALREGEERFRQLAEAVPEVFWVSTPDGGRILYVSPAYERVWGRSCKELYHQPRTWMESVVPEDREALVAALAGYSKDASLIVLPEYRIERPDGSVRWICARAYPVRDDGGQVYRIAGVAEDITERRHREGEVRASEERYRALFESNPHPMWVYDLKTLAFLAVNDAAIVHYGYSREEFLGMTLKDIRPMEDIPALLAVVAKLSAGTNRSGQWRHRKKDGSLIEVEITSHGLYFAGRPAELVLVSDITERKRAEEALRFTQFAVDHAGDAVFWIDAEARFVYVNEAACRSLGYSRQELLSLTVHDVDPDYPRDAWPAHWAETKRRGCMVFESRHRAKDGRLFPVEINANCLEYDGKEYNCSFARNITDRKRLEQQLAQSQKMEAIGRLAGGVAHDFNNLLAVISGYTESLLRHVGQDSALRNSVAEIERAAERGASLTRQLLAFSRRQVIEPRVLDLNEVVKGLGEMLERTMGRKIRMRIECGEGLGKIHSDAGQMEQVVVNLALNARDSMSDGGELRIETGNVKVADGEARELGLPGGEYVRLSVCDTGRGMDDEVRSRVFEPFFTTKEGGGTGLGLSIVYGIVQQAGGTVAVRSRVGEGSRFDVLLPRAEESETEKGRAGGGGEVKGRASG